MSRLIELLTEAAEYTSDKDLTLEQKIELQARFLENKGVVCPPVKIGQFMFVAHEGKVKSVIVHAIRVDTKYSGKRFCVAEVATSSWSYYKATFSWDSVGKTIFYTKEEAQAELDSKVGK